MGAVVAMRRRAVVQTPAVVSHRAWVGPGGRVERLRCSPHVPAGTEVVGHDVVTCLRCRPLDILR